MPFDRLIFYGIAAAATVAILVFAYRLSRRYLQDFASYYFYYLLLSSPLAILGKPFPILVAGFIRLEGLQADQFFLLFDGLLAKPLWILALFLLIKCVAAMLGRKLPRSFVAGFFIFWGGFLVSTWFIMVRFFQTSRFSTAALAFGNVFNYLDIFAPLLVFIYGIFGSLKISEISRRAGVRIFCWIGFVSKALFWILIFLYFSFTIPFLVGVALPIPALLYLSAYLKKISPDVSKISDDPAAFESFYSRFNITPREKEIIGLICAGRGNQAIADALFISVHTVKRHVNQVYQKVNVRNRVQLANAVRESAKKMIA
jgi:DNA-binding CsgD family transcriptional regulator